MDFVELKLASNFINDIVTTKELRTGYNFFNDYTRPKFKYIFNEVIVKRYIYEKWRPSGILKESEKYSKQIGKNSCELNTLLF